MSATVIYLCGIPATTESTPYMVAYFALLPAGFPQHAIACIPRALLPHVFTLTLAGGIVLCGTIRHRDFSALVPELESRQSSLSHGAVLIRSPDFPQRRCTTLRLSRRGSVEKSVEVFGVAV